MPVEHIRCDPEVDVERDQPGRPQDRKMLVAI